MFPYKWNLKDGYSNADKNSLNVFGSFLCGGGSTMGYKLAGYNHIGGIEIDKRMSDVYIENHKPKYMYTEDIRTFNTRTKLPEELYDLDIFDGSPPCSTFSMSGSRESAWGKKKKFAEGQAEQTLDDLFFEYIKTIDKLRPKVFIAENVSGILKGNATMYVKEICRRVKTIGYDVQVFLLDASTMGVPQRRQRVFFIGNRLNFPKLKLQFNEKPIMYREFAKTFGNEPKLTTDQYKWWSMCSPGKSFSSIHPKGMWFNAFKCSFNKVCNTLNASGGNGFSYHPVEPRKLNNYECQCIGSFPLDYNFLNSKPQYLIGMSVPPVMMAHIAQNVYTQWLGGSDD